MHYLFMYYVLLKKKEKKIKWLKLQMQVGCTEVHHSQD